MLLQKIGLVFFVLGFGIALTISFLLPVNVFPEVAEMIRENPHDVLSKGEIMITTSQIQAASREQHPWPHAALLACLGFGLILMVVGISRNQ